MGYKKGDVLFHVEPNGNIHKVVAQEDEQSGSVSIRYRTGKSAEIGTFHLFATENAANRAAISRTQTAQNKTPVKIIRNPK